MINVNKKYYTVGEIAKHIRCSIPTIYRYVSQRNIPYIKQGHRVLFELDKIDGWMEANRVVQKDVTKF